MTHVSLEAVVRRSLRARKRTAEAAAKRLPSDDGNPLVVSHVSGNS